jgi:hypothetical protein
MSVGITSDVQSCPFHWLQLENNKAQLGPGGSGLVDACETKDEEREVQGANQSSGTLLLMGWDPVPHSLQSKPVDINASPSGVVIWQFRV